MELKKDTVKKAIKAGRVIIPSKAKDHQLGTTKSQRSVIDDRQTMGKACSNTIERVLTIQTGSSCPIKFNDQTYLQHAGVLLALPSLVSQGVIEVLHNKVLILAE